VEADVSVSPRKKDRVTPCHAEVLDSGLDGATVVLGVVDGVVAGHGEDKGFSNLFYT